MVPTEHGGWGFLGEPLLLGLLVAFSPAAPLLAVATIAAFLARQPLKLALSDRRRGKRYPRTAVAERAFALFAVLGAITLAGSVLVARGPMLLAVGLASPLAAVALAFDLSLRSRSLVAELAATLALASVASAMALAAGWDAGAAFGLWGILAARVVPSILYVRARLRLERGEPAGRAGALASQALAVAWAAWLAARGLAPWPAVGAIGLLALRAAHGLSPWRPSISTMQLGLGELIFGALTVLAVALGTWLRF